MEIGQPKRVIEVEPATAPLPGALPDLEPIPEPPGPVPEPVGEPGLPEPEPIHPGP
jgi:hypothetical protein